MRDERNLHDAGVAEELIFRSRIRLVVGSPLHGSIGETFRWDAGQALKTASERFERESASLNDSQRNARQRQLMEQDRDFQRRRREFQEDLNSRKQEELQHILDRANRVVKQVAEAEKYDVILQEAVYVNPRLDITDKVIKALNAGK